MHPEPVILRMFQRSFRIFSGCLEISVVEKFGML